MYLTEMSIQHICCVWLRLNIAGNLEIKKEAQPLIFWIYFDKTHLGINFDLERYVFLVLATMLGRLIKNSEVLQLLSWLYRHHKCR